MTMKRRLFLFGIACLSATLNGMAQSYDIAQSGWQLHFEPETKKIDLLFNEQPLLAETYAEAVDYSKGTADTLRSYNATTVSFSHTDITDELGEGKVYAYDYLMADGRQLRQAFAFYPESAFVTVRLYVYGAEGDNIVSNYLAPIKTEAKADFLPEGGTYRMLQVPLDNDHFVSYYSNFLRGELMSFSTTAIFDGKSRKGFVCGAIDHDTWKSAIYANCPSKSDGTLLGFSCFSGVRGYAWMDNKEHGRLTGPTIASSRFVIGLFNDWRDGMEAFAGECCKVAPPYEWEGGKPVGWSSWGVMQNYITLQSVCDVSDFIAQELTPRGFHDTEGKTVISLDAFWNDNLTPNDRAIAQFVEHCKQNNQIPGIYAGLFCDFAKDPNRIVQGTNNKYRYRDIWLKVNGEPWELDGAYCLDPTHPATKLAIKYDLQRFYEWGIRYVKVDFLSHGIIEADSYYNPEVTTGVQAYNEGMQFMNDVLKKYEQPDDRMYMLMSISPIFPYQYAPARRICCDSWGTIDQTQYEMNSLSLGWWLDKLYHANDPDHMVMHLIDGGAKEAIGVSRARLTSGAVTGSYITGDNYSFSPGNGMTEPKGYPAQARERALELLTNNDVTEIVRTCKGFRPLNGYNATKEDCADNFLMQENEQYYYLSVLNYSKLLPMTGTMDFSAMGVDPSNVGSIKELWLGEEIVPTASGFGYKVPASDARIYRIDKKSYADGIRQTDAKAGGVQIKVTGRQLSVRTAQPGSFVTRIYNLQGQCVRTFAPATGLQQDLSDLPRGLYVVTATTESNDTTAQKVVIY